MAFIISYVPSTQTRNSKLIDNIKSYPSWAILSAYTYIVTASPETDSSRIRDDLTIYLRLNDKLFVAELTGQAAWRAFDMNMTNWLKKNL